MLFGFPNLLPYIHDCKLRMEIVSNSSGYWIVDKGFIDGPYINVELATEALEEIEKWQKR